MLFDKIEGDFDADGVQEFAFYSLNQERDLQLRIQDPTDKPHVFWEQSTLSSTEGEISVRPTAESEQDLIAIRQASDNPTTQYFSYHPDVGINQALPEKYQDDSIIKQFVPKKVIIGKSQEQSETILCLTEGLYRGCPEETDILDKNPLKLKYSQPR